MLLPSLPPSSVLSPSFRPPSAFHPSFPPSSLSFIVPPLPSLPSFSPLLFLPSSLCPLSIPRLPPRPSPLCKNPLRWYLGKCREKHSGPHRGTAVGTGLWAPFLGNAVDSTSVHLDTSARICVLVVASESDALLTASVLPSLENQPCPLATHPAISPPIQQTPRTCVVHSSMLATSEIRRKPRFLRHPLWIPYGPRPQFHPLHPHSFPSTSLHRIPSLCHLSSGHPSSVLTSLPALSLVPHPPCWPFKHS